VVEAYKRVYSFNGDFSIEKNEDFRLYIQTGKQPCEELNENAYSMTKVLIPMAIGSSSCEPNEVLWQAICRANPDELRFTACGLACGRDLL